MMTENLYSIGDLEKISGIKSHTIRIWEQRYNILKPTRSEGNTRYYSEGQMMKLLNIAFLNRHGLKISKIADYTPEQLTNEVSTIAIGETNADAAVHALLLASVNYDQQKVKDLFLEFTSSFGTEGAFINIIFPFLRIIGYLWVSGKITPGHEHFFSNLCRQKLFCDTEHIPSPSKKTSALLILPEWDFHELSLLFFNYLLKKKGFSTTYLGQAVPVADAVKTCEIIKPDYIVCTFIGPTNQEQITSYLSGITSHARNVKLLVSGPHIDFDVSKISARIKSFESAHEVVALFKDLE